LEKGSRSNIPIGHRKSQGPGVTPGCSGTPIRDRTRAKARVAEGAVLGDCRGSRAV